MPLYIKLDYGNEGNIHAWVSRNDSDWGTYLSEASASTSKACLRRLALKLGKLDREKVSEK
jgi:hypothetical protein